MVCGNLDVHKVLWMGWTKLRAPSSSNAWEIGHKLTAMRLNRAAYERENRHDLAVLLQKELFSFVFPSAPSRLPPAIQNIIVGVQHLLEQGHDPGNQGW